MDTWNRYPSPRTVVASYRNLGCIVAMVRGLLLTQQGKFLRTECAYRSLFRGRTEKNQRETGFWWTPALRLMFACVRVFDVWCTPALRLILVCVRVFDVWCTPALRLMSVCVRVFAVWCTLALWLMSVCARAFAVSTSSGRCTCSLLAAVIVSSDYGTPWSLSCPWCLSSATRHQ